MKFSKELTKYKNKGNFVVDPMMIYICSNCGQGFKTPKQKHLIDSNPNKYCGKNLV